MYNFFSYLKKKKKSYSVAYIKLTIAVFKRTFDRLWQVYAGTFSVKAFEIIFVRSPMQCCEYLATSFIHNF